MAHPKNQHYVPKVLLKNFSSKDSFIWAYDKDAKKKDWKAIKQRPINRVASENYFYDQIENNKEFSFEYELSKIEREIAPIIEKLVTNKNINVITNIEREKVSYFVAVQFLRTKWRLKMIKEQTLDFNQKIKEAFGTNEEQLDSKSLWFSLFEASREFSVSINNKVWFLGESKNLFYISDNPVVLQNTINNGSIRGALGLDSYGIEIYLPLTDSLILCMFCEKLLENKHGILNLEKFNYEGIVNVNALQFFQSDRFVFSTSNKFEMINEAIDI